MYAPAPDDEITSLVNYVDQQLAAIRAATYGLTEEQARERPCRSALSVSGIVKHVTRGMRGAVTVLVDRSTDLALDEAAFAAYLGSFALTDEETTVGVLEEFDAARSAYLTTIAGVDPDADALAPPTPWNGIYEARPIKTRYYVLHQVEEMARHAGHADIIREQLDGVAVPNLVLTLEGAQRNQFFEPYVPGPGTIGSS